MRKPLLLLLAAVMASVLAACGSTATTGGAHSWTATPYGPFKPAAVRLTDTAGAPYEVTTSPTTPLTFVFFGYTNCPDECPAVMSQLSSAFSRLTAEQTSKFTMVFVTSDPARDTSAVERAWLNRYNPDFVGLTGPMSQIEKLARSVKLFVEESKRLPSGGFDVPMHDTHVLILNAKHVVIGMWAMETEFKQYVSDIQALLNGEVP